MDGHLVAVECNELLISIVTGSTETYPVTRLPWPAYLLAAAGLSICVLSGCATSDVGVRADYTNRQIAEVAVWPFYSDTSFELSDAARDRVETSGEQSAVSWFEQRESRVVPPDVVSSISVDEAPGLPASSAENGEAGEPFGVFEVELGQRYNPGRRHRPSQSASLLKQLYRDGELSARYVLFGRVVYHTETTCRVRGDAFYSRAEVFFDPEVTSELPNPCAVTFLQFKLVDAKRGATVWFNEGLREFHVPEMTAGVVTKNTRALVDRLLGGPDGVTDVLGGSN
jgi:hypothetical protein